MQRIEELVKLINKYQYEYYVLDNPTISDKEFDILFDELVKLERETGIVLDNSPTKRVGGEASKGFRKHAHKNRLYSLEKCKTLEELANWCEGINKVMCGKTDFSLEYKLDGLSLCLTYKDKLLVSAATRGDGRVGEVVTNQVKAIKAVPLQIEFNGEIEIVGEGFMPLSNFERYNKTAAEPLKNPRNGAAGAIRSLDPNVAADRKLSAVFYHINFGGDVKTQKDAAGFLKKNRFRVEKCFVSNDIQKIISEIKKVDRTSLDFEIDGMVIKVNDYTIREKLGFTDRFPKWAIAYKFEAEEVTTTVLDVVWQVGRSGKLTPVAILEPVELCGATVTRATLNNFDDIVRKSVSINSSVFIRRSNDVIPEILALAKKGDDAKEVSKPIICPACDAQVFEEGAHIFCPNIKNCPPQIEGRLVHFCSKEGMNIEGVSDKTVEQFVRVLGIVSPSGLYSAKSEDLTKLEGFKDKKIANFLNNISASKSAGLENFINALGIPTVGRKTARDLALEFKSIEGLRGASVEQLIKIHSVGEIMASAIVSYFIENSQEIDRLIAFGINPLFSEQNIEKSSVLSGKTVVITGTFEQKRSELEKMLLAKGAKISSSISKSTDILFAGESAGSKLDKAKALGVEIFTSEHIRLHLQ